MGKTCFYKKDISKIEELLAQLEKANERDTKKSIRNKLRKLGYYISSFNTIEDSNTVAGFKRLLKDGVIKVIDGNDEITSTEVKIEAKKSQSMDITNLKKGLEPWIDEQCSVIILGTLPGDESILKQKYYASNNNSFWKIMQKLFEGYDAENQKDFILSHHIALWDCLKQGVRKGSTDTGFESDEMPNDLKSLLNKYSNIKTIILNGKTKTRGLFEKYFRELSPNYTVIALNSTSNANPVLFTDKLEEWKILKGHLK